MDSSQLTQQTAGVYGLSVCWYWAGAIFVIVIGALFATVSTVVSSIPATRLTVLYEESSHRARRAFGRYMHNSERVIASWLVGKIAATAGATVLIMLAAHERWNDWAAAAGILLSVTAIGLLTQIGVVMVRHWLPTSLVSVAVVMYPFELITLPLALPLWGVSRMFGKQLPHFHADIKTREHEMGLILDEGQRDGSMELERVQMLKNILEFEDLMASEVMVPRTLMTAIDASTSLQQVLEGISEKGHSRYPVYCDSVDNVVGLLYAKDLFRVIYDGGYENKTVRDVMRTPVNFVPETKPVSVLLREMRSRRLHLAVVVDDYGGVSGIVTLEDIIEEIVGDIQDEHDKEQDRIELLEDGSALVDAAIPIADLSEFLGVDLPEEGDFVSLGGWMIHRAAKVPPPGEALQEAGLIFIVKQADERRVIKVQICSIANDAMEKNPSDCPDADNQDV